MARRPCDVLRPPCRALLFCKLRPSRCLAGSSSQLHSLGFLPSHYFAVWDGGWPRTLGSPFLATPSWALPKEMTQARPQEDETPESHLKVIRLLNDDLQPAVFPENWLAHLCYSPSLLLLGCQLPVSIPCSMKDAS